MPDHPPCPPDLAMAAAPNLAVLVLDGGDIGAPALVPTLEALGHRVQLCATGAAALAEVGRRVPDLVLIEQGLLGREDPDVLARLRQLALPRWLPLVVTSATASETQLAPVLALGADDFLHSTLTPQQLRARLLPYQQLRAVNAQLQAANAQLRHQQTLMPDPVFTCDTQWRLLEANQAAQQLLRDMGQACRPGLPVLATLGLEAQRLDDSSYSRVTAADGSTRSFLVTRSEATGPGQGSTTTLVLRDRSAELKVERMKDEFLATVSHELRTPLTSILGAISILDAGAAGAMPDKARPLLQMAKRNGERLSRLIDDVMDLTKLEGDQIRLNLRTVDLMGLLQEAVHSMMGYAQTHQVQLVLDTPSPQALATADSARLGQVVTNLLSNAIKHSPRNGTVRVRLVGRSKGWRIEVQDQGPGVPEKFRSRLFEKFSQADATDVRQTQGTGLGLYISRQLVRRMGGEVALDPHAAGAVTGRQGAAGATFFVELPSAQQQALPTLVVSRDLSQRERWGEWLAICGPVAQVADASAAREWVQRHGAVAAVVADLTAQGLADEFYSSLTRVCPAAAIVLAGDAGDRLFAQARGARWVAPGARARPELIEAVNQARISGAARAEAAHA